MLGRNRYQVANRALPPPTNKLWTSPSINKCRKLLISSLVLVLLARWVVPGAFAQVKYTVTILQTPGECISMNNTGQIIGAVEKADGLLHAYIYQGGPVQDIGTFDRLDNIPIAINNAGQVIGYFSDPEIDFQIAYVRNADGTLVNLGSIDGSTFNVPMAINDHGVVVGYAGVAGSTARAFIYQNGQMSAVDNLEGYSFFNARCINNAGQIIALFRAHHNDLQSGLITGTSLRNLGTLPGGWNVAAAAMNDHGEIVGVANPGDPRPRAFLYSHDHLHPIGDWYPTAINNSGQIVGYSQSAAVLYSGGKERNLNSLLVPNSDFSVLMPLAITDAGQILAIGTNKETPVGTPNGLLTPIK
jgi:probable HAF family extracellular repeat protein